jgi:hypothetical protein
LLHAIERFQDRTLARPSNLPAARRMESIVSWTLSLSFGSVRTRARTKRVTLSAWAM